MARALAIVVSLASLAAGCVGDGGPSAPDASAVMSVPSVPATTAPPGAASTSTSTQVEGWTLEISRPAPGATIGPRVTLCYEVTGTAREAVVALDVRLFAPGAEEPVASTRSDASVGRGASIVDLDPVAKGGYDLQVGLVVDGDLPPSRVVRIPGVSLRRDAPPTGCT